jgi:hypothetical protein
MVGTGRRLGRCLVCVVSVVAALEAPVVPASATTKYSPVGFWDSYAYITDWGPGPVKHATPAGPFPNPTTITSYDPVTGAFSGMDNAWDVGKEVINGVLHGDSVTYTIIDPGVVLHGQGTVTFYSDGTATWIGTWSNSIGQRGTEYGTLKGFLLAGMVQALSCGEDSCSPPTGLPGQPVLVQGTSRDGSAVSVSATSDADGTWSVGVPNGTYEAGPSEDGHTFGGLGYDPASVPDIAVNGSGVGDIDFRACAIAGDSVSSEVDRAPLGTDRVPFATAGGASSAVSQCTSVYTVTLGGDISQKMLVDPGEGARYNRNNDGTPDFRGSSGWWNAFKHSFPFMAAVQNREYPGCFTHSQAFALAKEKKTVTGADVRWYSYIQGPAKLSPVTVKFAYNQSNGQVTLLGDPVNDLSKAKITRVWVWREYGVFGKQIGAGRCYQTSEVPALAFPVPDKRGFTLVVAWGFPFSGSGAQTNLNLDKAEFLEAAEKAGAIKDQHIATYWEQAGHDGKFALMLGLEAYGVGKGLKVLELGAESAAVRKWVSKEVAESAGTYAGVAESTHQAKDVHEVTEWLNAFSNEQGYMMAVVRGQFEPVFSHRGRHVATILALSQATTKFPNISISINRQAFAYRDDWFPPFSDNLPWRNSPLGTTKPASPAVSNPFARNPTGLLVVNDESYASGTKALEALREATDESLSTVTYSINTHGNLAWNFENEQRETGVAPPECKPTLPGDVISQGDDPNTICWRFNDSDA